MRLLQYNKTGELIIANFFGKDTIPPYAVLWHRWLADIDEPTFELWNYLHGNSTPNEVAVCSSGI